MIAGAKRRTLRHRALAFTAYEIGEGPLVLCLHGFPDTPATFETIAPALARSGFRVVAPFLRGYERQSIPVDGDYHVNALAADVGAWIDEIGGGPAHLVAHDWGATIAYATIARTPDKVASLCTMAVPHPGEFGARILASPEQLARSQYIFFFQQAGVAEAAVAENDFAYLEGLWRAWSPDWVIPETYLTTMKTTFRAPGVLTAALSYYRQAMDQESEAALQSRALLTAPCARPVFGIHGSNDGCIGADLFEASMTRAAHLAGVKTARIDNAGHFAHLEQPSRVNDLLIEWLQSH